MIKDIYKQEINEILSLFKTKNFLNAKIKIENLIKTYPNDMFLENMYGVFLLNCKNLKDAILNKNRQVRIRQSYSFIIGNYIQNLSSNDILLYFKLYIEGLQITSLFIASTTFNEIIISFNGS